MNSLVSIAIADDHPNVREWLANYIISSKKFDVIIQASNGKELIEMITSSSVLPDICVLDISMPIMDGHHTLIAVRKRWPSMKVLMLSMFITNFNVIKALKEGANGVFSKNDSHKKLLTALHEIHDNSYYVGDYISPEMLKALNRSELSFNITEKESEFLKLTCTEMSYRQIAEVMKISPKTVDGYREKLFEKLNIKCKTGLAMFAIRSGIVPIESI